MNAVQSTILSVIIVGLCANMIFAEEEKSQTVHQKTFKYQGLLLSPLNNDSKAITIKTKDRKVLLNLMNDTKVTSIITSGNLPFNPAEGYKVNDKVRIICEGSEKKGKITCSSLEIEKIK